MTTQRGGMAGQAAAEYVLILGGVALLLIAAFIALQTNLTTVLQLAALPADAVAIVPMTPLGSTFSDISNGMINRIMDFYRKNNRWPRSWGDFAYTDIGLDPADWRDSHDGIIYKPVGNRVAISPANGYTFVVQDINGNKITMPSSYNWSFVYNMQTGTWHHKSFDGPRLNIATLQVIPPK